MPTVHAYRRIKPHTAEVGGERFRFDANDEGHFVCDVPEGAALERFLSISEGYVLYGAQASAEDGDDPASPYVITSGDATVDLRALDREALLAFAREHEVSVHHKSGADKLRERIVAVLVRGEE